jgi:phytol kinase
MMNPWLGIAAVLGALGGLLGGLRLYQRWGEPHPELVRKLLHIGMGLVAVCFPWIFDQSWPVLLLGVLSLGGMVALRTVGSLRRTVGTVVSGVDRASLGEVYFPLAIAILWLLFLFGDGPFERRALLYCVPLLLLTLADATAALVGARYGSWRYTTADGRKSMEGSFTFFLCAFLCVHIPVLLGTETGKLETLLIAVLLAWVAMMFEAIAWAGLDNLVLPLVAYLLLRIYLDLSAPELGMRLGVTAVLMVFVLAYRSRTTLEGSAVLGAILFGYISWTLGGWRWLQAPLILFLGYTLLSPPTEVNSRRIHNIHAVVCVCSAGLIWLFLYRLLDKPELLYLFTLAFACQMAIIGIARLGYDYPGLSGSALVSLCVLKGWAVLFVPYLLLEWWLAPIAHAPASLLAVLAALPGVALAAVGFYLTQPQVRDCPVDTPRWLRQAAHGALGSAAGLLPLYLM